MQITTENVNLILICIQELRQEFPNEIFWINFMPIENENEIDIAIHNYDLYSSEKFKDYTLNDLFLDRFKEISIICLSIQIMSISSERILKYLYFNNNK